MLDLRNGEPLYIVGGVRTPIGKFGGALASLSAPDLGAIVVEATVARSGVPAESLGHTIMGHGRQAGAGPNPARQAAVRGGVPHEVPAFTVNQACASGMKALILAAQSLRLGTSDAIVCGGMESMSNTPYLLPAARWGARLGHAEIVDGMYQDGFMCPLCGDLMGRTAERLAEQYQVDRERQDAYAVESQHRAARASAAGDFAAETTAVEVRGRRETVTIERDEHLRPDATMESMARLKPVFKEGGTVHPGNSSGITDGAAAMVLVTESFAERHGLRPQARLLAACEAGVDPAVMGIGPVPAVRQLLESLDLTAGDLDLIELNEAFAAQVLAVMDDLGLDHARTNIDGGAIALGHPIGCTGARIVITLINALERRQESLGLATLCVSGGMGTSVLLERVS
ncbi:MAG: acetyl-CoA C-acyltransferase [Acidobacteria bacterium]|nr:acetyl-CoA C-acyltransferase [Acidobacteriota bacterium]